MKYKDFKGLKLSRLGMGNMRLPETDGKIDYDKAEAIIDLAMSGGINYYDTAYVYHHGTSESFLGKVLKKYSRDSYYLATKFNVLASKDIEKVFNEQLERLDTDHIDFYLLHSVTETTAKEYMNEDYINFLKKEKAKGRIRHIGFSSHAKLPTLKKMLEYSDVFEFVQIQLNYLDWTLQDAKGQYEMLKEHGLPVWVMEPVRGGRLAKLDDKYEKTLKDHLPEASISSWAFRYLFGLDDVGVILSGMSNLEQLRDNLKTFDEAKTLDEKENELLMEVKKTILEELTVPCTTCHYCTDGCPMQIDIPKWMDLYNRVSLNKNRELYLNSKQEPNGPDTCINCGQCKSQCPQNIDIPAILKKYNEMKL